MLIYKIMSRDDWNESLALDHLKPSSLDLETGYIHLCTEQQIQTVLDKFWKGKASVVLVTIDPTKVVGRLEYEANRSGGDKYYHLYDGHIPRAAIIKAEQRRAAPKV